MKVYYAHCMALYGTPQENRDVETLEDLGFEVVNPNTTATHVKCNRLKSEGYDSETIMDTVFQPMVASCMVLAFRALPDGRIPAGVAKEIQWAADYALAIIELPGAILGRGMSVETTREYLRDVGQR